VLWQKLILAVRDAGSGKTPIVAHRKNRGDWLAVMRLSDLLEILRKLGSKQVEDMRLKAPGSSSQEISDVLCAQRGVRVRGGVLKTAGSL